MPRKRKTPRKIAEPSALERAFSTYWIMLASDLPPYTPEFIFDEEREWRFDCAWEFHKVFVELDGGVFSGGRHVRGKGFTEDCVKLNKATTLGWRYLRFTTQMLHNDPHTCINQIRGLLQNGSK